MIIAVLSPIIYLKCNSWKKPPSRIWDQGSQVLFSQHLLLYTHMCMTSCPKIILRKDPHTCPKIIFLHLMRIATLKKCFGVATPIDFGGRFQHDTSSFRRKQEKSYMHFGYFFCLNRKVFIIFSHLFYALARKPWWKRAISVLAKQILGRPSSTKILIRWLFVSLTKEYKWVFGSENYPN